MALAAVCGFLLMMGCASIDQPSGAGVLNPMEETARNVALKVRRFWATYPGDSVLVVTPREVGNVLLDSLSQFFAERVADALSEGPDVTLVRRDLVSELVSEMEFQRLPRLDEANEPDGFFDEATTAELGRFSGASHILFVSVDDSLGFLDLQAIVANVETATVDQVS